MTTLFASSYFLQIRKHSEFDVNHFQYIFIDESACAHESATMIPIAACSTKNKIVPRIILAGDPLQLPATGNSYTKI